MSSAKAFFFTHLTDFNVKILTLEAEILYSWQDEFA